MKPSREVLIDGLLAEFVSLEHDGFIEEEGLTYEVYEQRLKAMTYEQLIEETGTDEGFPMEEWLEAYSQ